MSNLSRLEAVSSSLDTAINKANSLPDAGGGSGGGGSVETCTVDLASAYDWDMEQLLYSDGNEVVDFFPNDVYSRMSLTVVKNTLLYIKTGGVVDIIIDGNAELIIDGGLKSYYLISINGDCSIDPV